jgi:hypothetical protein
MARFLAEIEWPSRLALRIVDSKLQPDQTLPCASPIVPDFCKSSHHSITPILHHSTTPVLHHSSTPSLQYSIAPSLQYSITSARTEPRLPILIFARLLLALVVRVVPVGHTSSSARGTAVRTSGSGIFVGATLREDGVWISDHGTRTGRSSASSVLTRCEGGRQGKRDERCCHSDSLSHRKQFSYK